MRKNFCGRFFRIGRIAVLLVFFAAGVSLAQTRKSGSEKDERPEVETIQMNVVQEQTREDERSGSPDAFSLEPVPGPADTLSKVEEMQAQANKILKENFSRFRETLPEGLPTQEPSVNIEDTGSEVVISLDLPGMKKRDLQIFARDGYLTINGRRNFQREEGNPGEEGKFYRRERFEGKFEKRIPLPPSFAARMVKTPP